ncbi:hypothetical protein D3C71_1372980 [compost metagenome]
MNRQELLVTEVELIDFMAQRAKKPDEDYHGKFHHLNFNWTVYSDRNALVMAVIDVLERADWEERRDFTAQMIWRVIEREDLALDNLMRAAFGGTKGEGEIHD